MVDNPRHRGMMECIQDRCENIPFAGIGGLDNRSSPKAPHYISDEDASEFIEGYIEQAKKTYGDDWRTCEFFWMPALVITDKE